MPLRAARHYPEGHCYAPALTGAQSVCIIVSVAFELNSSS